MALPFEDISLCVLRYCHLKTVDVEIIFVWREYASTVLPFEEKRCRPFAT